MAAILVELIEQVSKLFAVLFDHFFNIVQTYEEALFMGSCQACLLLDKLFSLLTIEESLEVLNDTILRAVLPLKLKLLLLAETELAHDLPH